MRLNEFSEALQVMDDLSGFSKVSMFCNNPRSLAPNLFAYDFDAYITTVVEVTTNGCIFEWVDVYDEDFMALIVKPKASSKYTSGAAWIKSKVEMMT